MPEITASSVTPADRELQELRKRYDAVNQQIREDRDSAQRFWENLLLMKRESLYRVKYTSLDAWARAELGVSRTHLYRLLNYQEKVGGKVPTRPPRAAPPKITEIAVARAEPDSFAFPTGDEPEEAPAKELEPTERQWRAIEGVLRPELREIAWSRCVADCAGRTPTLRDVDRTIAEIVAEEASQGRVEYPLDQVGQPITGPAIQRVFERSRELQDLQRDIQRMRERVKELAAEDIGANLQVQKIDSALKECWQTVKHAIPYAVIPAGAEKKVQSRAANIGWLTDMQWDRLPAEFKVASR